MIMGIHHVSILASSEKSIKFYEKLGFVVKFRKERANDIIVLMFGHGMQIEMFIDDRHPVSPMGLEEPLGVRHFALVVDCLEKTMIELQLDHTDIGTDWQGIRYCYVVDPDGNQIEFHE